MTTNSPQLTQPADAQRSKTPLHLYVVRHGETAWSLTSQHTGRTDIPLTERGEDEARELGRHLQDIPFTHVLTSPLQRAQQTCALARLSPAAEIEPDLMEWDYGDYDGRRTVDIDKERVGWNLFRDGCPHGETPTQVSDRADHLIAHLRSLDGNVAVFSHGQFLCALVARWIGLPLVEAQHFLIDTASLSILSYDPHHPELPVIARWNATTHTMFELRGSTHVGETTPPTERAIDRWENEGGEILINQGNLTAQKQDKSPV